MATIATKGSVPDGVLGFTERHAARRAGFRLALESSCKSDGGPLPTLEELEARYGPEAVEEAALRELHRTHYPWALRFAGSVLRGTTDADADDAVQSAFLAVWTSIEDFVQPGTAFRAWLTVIVRFRALDLRDKSLTQRRYFRPIEDMGRDDIDGSIEDASLQFAHPTEGQPSTADARDLLTRVQAKIADLPDHERRTVILRAAGFEHQEIADLIGVSRGAVERATARGRKILRRAVRGLGAAHA